MKTATELVHQIFGATSDEMEAAIEARDREVRAAALREALIACQTGITPRTWAGCTDAIKALLAQARGE